MESFRTGKGHIVEIFGSGPGPVIYMPCMDGEGEAVYSLLKEHDFSLAAISGLDWNRELSPWKAARVFSKDEDFTGGAPLFLRELLDEIIPRTEELAGSPSWRGIAGYSLSGLFALYASFGSGAFQRAASASGSLWFPGFVEWAEAKLGRTGTEAVYLSLGDREAKTHNRLMASVEDETRNLSKALEKAGLRTVFSFEHGGHFTDCQGRLARGIAWLLDE